MLSVLSHILASNQFPLRVISMAKKYVVRFPINRLSSPQVPTFSLIEDVLYEPLVICAIMFFLVCLFAHLDAQTDKQTKHSYSLIVLDMEHH